MCVCWEFCKYKSLRNFLQHSCFLLLFLYLCFSNHFTNFLFLSPKHWHVIIAMCSVVYTIHFVCTMYVHVCLMIQHGHFNTLFTQSVYGLYVSVCVLIM